MNLAFLILIAIPLGLYLLVLIASTRNFTPDGKPSPRPDEPVARTTSEAPADAAIVSAIPGETSADEPADTAEDVAIGSSVTTSTSIDEPSAAVRESSMAVAEGATAENSVESVPPEIAVAAVTVSEILEPAPDSTDVVLAALEPDKALVEPPTSPAAPEPAAKPTPTAATSAREEDDPSQPILSGQPLILPGDAPKYAFDYRGRLWVEKKRRGFFRQLRRPQLPPEDPTNPSKD